MDLTIKATHLYYVNVILTNIGPFKPLLSVVLLCRAALAIASSSISLISYDSGLNPMALSCSLWIGYQFLLQHPDFYSPITSHILEPRTVVKQF